MDNERDPKPSNVPATQVEQPSLERRPPSKASLERFRKPSKRRSNYPPVSAVCCVDRSNLCRRCIDDSVAQLRGVAENRGHFWAVEVEARSTPAQRALSWPVSDVRMLETAREKLVDITTCAALIDELVPFVIHAARRCWAIARRNRPICGLAGAWVHVQVPASRSLFVRGRPRPGGRALRQPRDPDGLLVHQHADARSLLAEEVPLLVAATQRCNAR